MRFAAVIFDLDGTLVDSERVILDAGMAALARLGHDPRREVLAALVGTVGDASREVLRSAYGAGFDHDAFDAAWARAADAAWTGRLDTRPGAADLLGHLAALGIPRAVATNSRTATAHESLTAAGLAQFFHRDHVHGRDMVARPKPAPDLFLRAARGLGADPARCLVFEDSDTGVAAALEAGMTVVHVPDQRPPASRAAHHHAATLLDGARTAGLID
jgi:HAD superfamily hydrolase (TIGR01509 family)